MKFPQRHQTALVLVVLFSIACASALEISNSTNDKNIDQISDICAEQYIDGICDSWEKVSDTTNQLTSEDVDASIDNTNTVQNTEINLLKEEKTLSQERIGTSWNNILSVFELLMEFIKILYYSLQIILILFTPYLYIKMLVWFRNMVTRQWTKKQR